MSVKKEANGRRSVELEVEVPGTPEQVWRAIATGPGISSWFSPTEVEEREGGTITFHLGPGMDSSGTVTAWEPPGRFAYEERDWGPNAPPLATELLVEARSGGTCVLRLVHSLFASGDEWDDQLESFESGWQSYFRILRLVLAHFQGRPCSSLRVMVNTSGPEAKAWEELTGALGLSGSIPGQRRRTGAGAPPLAGVVEPAGERTHPHELVLRIDEPAPGLALLGAYSWNEQVFAAISLYLFGDEASAAMERAEPLWRTWMNERFSAAREASHVA